jgi:hypothetical protein
MNLGIVNPSITFSTIRRRTSVSLEQAIPCVTRTCLLMTLHIGGVICVAAIGFIAASMTPKLAPYVFGSRIGVEY